MAFALITERILERLTDRELKVFAGLNILLYKNHRVITLEKIKEITGKSKTQLIEILKNLEKKGIIKRNRKGRNNHFEICIELKYDFEIDGLAKFDTITRKKIKKVIELFGLGKAQVEKILSYLETKNPKDIVRYFNYLAQNYDKIFIIDNEVNNQDEIIIDNPTVFFEFQIYLNKLKKDFKIKPLFFEKDKWTGKVISGKWIITGKNIKKLYQNFKNEIMQGASKNYQQRF